MGDRRIVTIRALIVVCALRLTEGFQGVCLPLSKRPEVREVIGEAAELIAFANCVMDRASFDDLIGACYPSIAL